MALRFNDEKWVTLQQDSHTALGICLLMAVLLHAALLTFVRMRTPSEATPHFTSLTVFLAPRTLPRIEPPPPVSPTTEVAPASARVVNQATASQPASPAINTTEPIQVQQSEARNATPVSAGKPTINLQDILESARHIAHEEGTRPEQPHLSSSNHAPGSQLALTAVIGKVFEDARPSRPTKAVQFADGMVQVTNPDGTVYCLMPRKEFERGGPVEAQGIPMTCP